MLGRLHPDRRVGVLFVHGIGEQQQSESVRWFGDALFGWVRQWYGARPNAPTPEVTAAALSYGTDLAGPARFSVRLPATGAPPDDQDAEWVIAEAHWADRISAPSLRVMVDWAVGSTALVLRRLRRELGATLDLVLARIRGDLSEREKESGRRAFSDPGLLAAVFEFLSGIVLGALYLVSLLLLPFVLIPLFLASLIPIESWRKFIALELIEPFLVKGIGDFRTFIEDDVQAAHIRAGLNEDLEWLATTGACEDIIVVAHSQGAVVAFDALTTSRSPAIQCVRKFMTAGGALNNAWHLYGHLPRLRRALPSHIHWVDFWSYYDPVAGSRLRPPVGVTIVKPTVDLQREMSWYEEYVDPNFDGPKHSAPTAPFPRQVTNSMNVLTDHDGYFRNPEQFLSRLASEIDRPREDYEKSRFHHGLEKELSYLRRTRVSALVSWRLYAMALFLVSIILIVVRDGTAGLVGAGASIGLWWSRIPGAELLGAPGAFIDGIRQALQSVAEDPNVPTWLASATGATATFLGDPFWGVARDLVISTLLVAAVFAVAYVVLTRFLYEPWDRREARASVLQVIPSRNPMEVYRRGFVVLAALLVLVFLVVDRLS